MLQIVLSLIRSNPLVTNMIDTFLLIFVKYSGGLRCCIKRLK